MSTTASGDGAGAREAPIASPLQIKERSPFWLPRDWQAFSERCECSHAAIPGSIQAIALQSIGRGGARCFEIFLNKEGSLEKIAQATVLKEADRYWFLHRLAVLPEFNEFWSAAMHSLLFHIGAGRYGYTRVISDEPSRTNEISSLAGATIESVRPVVVQSVDFKNWKNWDDYFQGISTNAKRNYKRAVKEIERLNIVTKRGLAALSELPFLFKCEQNVTASKRLRGNDFRFAVGFIVKAVVLGDRQFVSIVRSGARRLGAISGVEFGARLFYLDGGRSEDQHGAQWYLIMAQLAFG